MSVKVVARLRPALETELDNEVVVTAHTQAGEPDGAAPTVVRVPNPRKKSEIFSFQFNRVFEAQTTQKELFETEIRPTIKHLFQGYDVTLFAYGVTGTGKTHTMRGGKLLEERGIIPRLLSAIYRQSRSMSTQPEGGAQVSVTLSYYEIYNDKIYDLFEPPEKRTFYGLPLRDNGSRTVVVGLTEHPCEDLATFEKLYDQANVNRSTSATKLNAHSSRSHAILCVKLSITNGDKTIISTASCIDLAGSEDNRRTDNKKERLIESSAINKSLFVLGQCVEAMNRGQQRIPYRESKMTRILALGQNNGMCICLLNLAPDKSFHLDTLSSLNFANRTKKIEIKETENKPIPRVPAKPAPRPSYAANTVAGVRRQALQTLSNITQNMNSKKAPPELPPKPAARSTKTFSFFKDETRPKRLSNIGKPRSPVVRDSTTFTSSIPKAPESATKPITAIPKAPEPGPKSTTVERLSRRLSKLASPGLSESAIDQLVDKRVNDILAAKASETPTTPKHDVDVDIIKRLETLEQKVAVQNAEQRRAKGLGYLLMAKQHSARGENNSALKMYKLARNYFPGNTKLETKIRTLQTKNQEVEIDPRVQDQPLEDILLDDTYYKDIEHESPGSDVDRVASKEQGLVKARERPMSDDLAVSTPRGQRLIDILKTRDMIQMRALKSMGTQKMNVVGAVYEV